MKATIIYLFLFAPIAFSFTLVSSNGGFPKPEVTINLSNNSCSTSGIDHETIWKYIEDSIDNYWNTVPTSSLQLKKGKIVDIDIDGSGVLSEIENNTILVGCSIDTSTNTFSTSDPYPEGFGGISSNGSNIAVGYVFLNNVYPNGLATRSKNRLLYVVAHELGHGIGLGHSQDPASIMSYNRTFDFPEFLSQDDFDGVTYLYPNEDEALSLIGSCGVINNIDNDDNNNWPMSALFGLSLSFVLILLKKLNFKKEYLTA